ncbi:cell division protein CrgA [Naumannella sp. ID2617S]|uniref:Cell division protein CrgA n=1 Tax=Enemella dayhoffiae TaxID=2016507 RepID=A0A255HBR3_9ACTN|nr:cell division protein CrgA [Enemella dayhoffiae]NNG19843.1 cell division protein CrgA [Naumannella sp. ID2617S]OYO25091.1 septation inhibitor protein [Enemella dayhoffiae]
MPESKVRKSAADKKKVKRHEDEVETRTAKSKVAAPGTRRWVAPAFITVGLIGVTWLVLYYIAGRDIPFINKLGDWNILIGMGLMAVSLGLSMLWK